MPPTNLRGTQIADGTVQRADVDVASVGQSLIRKVLSSTGIALTSTGADAGTGDVTILGANPNPSGRLTLTSGAPVLNSTVSAATTIYYTPYLGSIVPIYNGSVFVPYSFTELSQALNDTTKSPAAAAASQVYDLFVWNDSGTIRCTRGPTWASGTGGSNTVRGTGAGGTSLARINGVYVNNVAITNGPGVNLGTYVGTIATDSGGGTVSFTLGSSASGGGAASIGLWNYYNRIRLRTTVLDSAANHTYATNTYRNFNNSATNRITFVVGVNETPVWAMMEAVIAIVTSGTAFISIALDGTTPGAAAVNGRSPNNSAASSTTTGSTVATVTIYPGIGLHYLQAVEAGDGSNTATFTSNTNLYGFQAALEF